MRAVFGFDALFSRKGEAQPAVQPAIARAGRNRFEDLARTLGAGDTGGGDEDVDLEADGSRSCGMIDAASGAGVVSSAGSAQVMPFPGPWMAEAPAPRSSAGSAVDTPTADAACASDEEAPDARSDAMPLDGSMIRRAPAQADRGAGRPWERLRRPVSAPADGPDPSAESAEPSEDLEVYLFGAIQDPQVGASVRGGAAPSATPAAQRRHVSVRLPAREHELLRQFARVCETTQQDVLRRALLTYMIEELRRRLDRGPEEEAGRPRS